MGAGLVIALTACGADSGTAAPGSTPAGAATDSATSFSTANVQSSDITSAPATASQPTSSDDAGSEPSGTRSVSSSTPVPSDGAEGRITISTAADGTRTATNTLNGEVTGIPSEPKRVLALWRTGNELADLGVKAVGQLEGEYLEDELGADVYAQFKDVPSVGTFESVDLERVIELDPDLIIGMDNGGLGIDYAPLQEIAPTVILKIAEPTDVWDNYPTVAELVGKQTDFEAKQASLDEKLAKIKSTYGDTVSALDVVSVSGQADGASFWVSTSKALSYRRLVAAGFGYDGRYTENPERYVAALTAENVPDLAESDVIFYDVDINGKVEPGSQALLDLAAFQRLPAVTGKKAFPLTSGVIYTFAGAEKQVADLERAAAALAGG